MRTYYLHYKEDTTINYLYLFLFHRIAEKNKTLRLYNIVRYNNLDELVDRMNERYKLIKKDCNGKVISKATLSRVLKSDTEQRYFIYDKESKLILLQNNFTTSKTNGKARFIKLTEREIDFLLSQNEKLLYSYYLFMKYSCGFSGKNYADFTANQFLEATNYSTKSGKYKTMLSNYNSLLKEEGFISISKFRFDGKERNGYSIL